MRATVHLTGHDIRCHAADCQPPETRLDGALLCPLLEAWARRYGVAVSRHRAGDLHAIGLDMFKALNGTGWAEAWTTSPGARTLEIQVDDAASALAAALLDAPWELLAHEHGYLAEDRSQAFEVLRRIGRPRDPVEPRYGDVKLMFMAAAPEGEHELDFEAEEAAILQATEPKGAGARRLHLVVEETGALGPLRERMLEGTEPYEVLHLSCHGQIDPHRGPFVALEHPEGGDSHVPAYAPDIVHALQDCDHTPLVFLSACRTAERADLGSKPSAQGTSEAIQDGRRPLEPFVRELVRAGVHNALGWDGSVYDPDAQAFARYFYGELAALKTLPQAVAHARAELLSQHRADAQRGQHWHLARLYVGPRGGGALARRGGALRRLPHEQPRDRFLDKARELVPVAGRHEFVGRRRSLQQVLRAFGRGSAGVLVQGMGNLGKSSLAARIRDRMTEHTPVVVFKQYDALALFDRIVEAIPAADRSPFASRWREAVAHDAASLADALEDALQGPLRAKPVLLIIDDLESILEPPKAQEEALVPVQAGFRCALAAVLAGFARWNTGSHLLLTSRYRFTLPAADGTDLATGLDLVPLAPMRDIERRKQLAAAALAAGHDADDWDMRLGREVIDAAEGNPGLQSVLMRPLLAGETRAVEQVLELWRQFRAEGRAPVDLDGMKAQGLAVDDANAWLAFFKRMAFQAYRDALTPSQSRTLAAACAFAPDLAIPRAAIEIAAQALHATDGGADLNRLLALGLVDERGMEEAVSMVSANPLARPLVPVASPEVLGTMAQAVAPALDALWAADDGTVPSDPRALELVRWHLAAHAPDPSRLDAAAVAGGWFLFNKHQLAKEAFVECLDPAWQAICSLTQTPSVALSLLMFDCAGQLGETVRAGEAARQLETHVSHEDAKDATAGSALLRLARRDAQSGEPDSALQHYLRASSLFEQLDSERNAAVARGGVADILQARGQLDEALRIRTEEELPVYERLGDVRSKAVTMGQIADILQDRGQLDEALRIRTEEELPVYERLGDVRSKAVTMGQIADILQDRGQLDEALALHEARLAIVDALKHADGMAHVRFSVAHLLLQRGDHEREGFQRIHANLAEAHVLSIGAGRVDAIEAIGRLFVQTLVLDGQFEKALEVLERVSQAFETLGYAKGVEQVTTLREMIEKRRDAPGP